MTTPQPTRVDGMGPLEPVPFIDLVAQHQTISEEVTSAVTKVFSEQRFILGDEVLNLESEIAGEMLVKTFFPITFCSIQCN